MRFCDWLPLLVIGELMDVPPEDAAGIKRWTDTKFALHRNPIPPENVHAVHRTLTDFRGYVADVIERHRSTPEPTTLIADLLDAKESEQLTQDELAAMYMLLLFGAHETTANMLGNGIGALFKNPDQLELLRGDPSLIPAAVEEFLRYESPPQFFPKRALADTELEGVEIPGGSIVLIAIGAANRDPGAFEEPDELDITRTPNDHLSLGHGIHFCIGGPVARLEGKIAFETMLRRFPDMSLAVEPDKLEYTATSTTRGYRALPVQLGRDRG
jgi:cytochrome P450